MYDWMNGLPSTGAGSLAYHSYFNEDTSNDGFHMLSHFPERAGPLQGAVRPDLDHCDGRGDDDDDGGADDDHHGGADDDHHGGADDDYHGGADDDYHGGADDDHHGGADDDRRRSRP